MCWDFERRQVRYRSFSLFAVSAVDSNVPPRCLHQWEFRSEYSRRQGRSSGPRVPALSSDDLLSLWISGKAAGGRRRFFRLGAKRSV
jgi:hypothetical protein